MVQFCPRCGTKAADDESLFCNTCGTRLPTVIQEKKELMCPKCGAKAPDEQSLFCNKCGSRLHAVPPFVKKERCPACDASLVDAVSAYCNVCGTSIRGSAPPEISCGYPRPEPEERGTVPPGTGGEIMEPYPERAGAALPVAEIPDAVTRASVQEKARRPLRKWGAIAGAAGIFLLFLAAALSGMIPGIRQSPADTSAPAAGNLDTVTTVVTRTPAQEGTNSPAETPPTSVPTTVAAVNLSAPGDGSASTSAAVNTTPTGAVETSPTAKITPSRTYATQPVPLGQEAFDGKGTLNVNGFSFRDKMSDPLPSYAVGKKYLIVNITYANVQENETVDTNLSLMKVTDGGGFPYEPVSDPLLENVYNGKSILHGEKRTGNLLFLVPPEATYLKLEYRFGNQSRATFLLQ
jgi:hypothetical protein